MLGAWLYCGHTQAAQVFVSSRVFGEGNTQKPGNGDLRWTGLEVATAIRVWAHGRKKIPARTNRDSCRTGSAHQGEAEDVGAGVPEGFGEQIPDLGQEDS